MVLLLGVITLSAVSGYFGSSKSLEFIKEKTQLADTLRQARGYAMTNFKVESEDCGTEALRFGVHLASDRYFLFAEPCKENNFSFGPEDVVLGEVAEVAQRDYLLEMIDDQKAVIDPPVSVFYEGGSGEFTAMGRDDGNALPQPIGRDVSRYLRVRLYGEDRLEDLIILQVSGLPDENSDLYNE